MRGSFDDAFCGATTPAGDLPISGTRLDPKDGAYSGATEAGFVYVPLSELNRWLPAAGAAGRGEGVPRPRPRCGRELVGLW